jgi:hypothetical protein
MYLVPFGYSYVPYPLKQFPFIQLAKSLLKGKQRSNTIHVIRAMRRKFKSDKNGKDVYESVR